MDYILYDEAGNIERLMSAFVEKSHIGSNKSIPCFPSEM